MWKYTCAFAAAGLVIGACAGQEEDLATQEWAFLGYAKLVEADE